MVFNLFADKCYPHGYFRWLHITHKCEINSIYILINIIITITYKTIAIMAYRLL